jgi:hypothetical protein
VTPDRCHVSFTLSEEQVERWGLAALDAGFGFHGPRFIKAAVGAFVSAYDKLDRPRPPLADLEVRLRRRRRARKP